MEAVQATNGSTGTQPVEEWLITPEPTSAVRYYLAILRRRWIVMALAVLIPLLAGIALYISTPKTYRGTAEVVINRQSLADEVNGTPDPTAGASDFIDIVQTDADAARSIQVARTALTATPGTHLTPQQFLNHSDVTASANADLLTFTADSRDSETANRLASAYAQAYTSYSAAQSAAAFRTASDQLTVGIAGAQAAHNAELVKSLKAKAAALQSLAALQTANEFVVTPSTIAKVTSPQKSVDIGLFLLLGLVLAVALAALLEGLAAERP
jgi:capsular polysaccharide biosynthesis protein